jgi:hypothetical protein
MEEMTNINFNEPSTGDVNSPGKPALTITQQGVDAWGLQAVTTNPGNTGAIQGISTINGVTDGTTPSWGVWGESRADKNGTGVIGVTTNHAGVHGVCQTGGFAVTGESRSDNGIAIRGIGRGLAGRFEGDVEVTGDIRLLNADCAEDFDVSTNGGQTIEPGTVMVLNDVGSLDPSCQAYDKKVAGVISGAGGYKPGIVLDTHHREEELDQESEDDLGRRMPVALVGKVYCKVDATLSAIEIGDLLTTSSTEGHAMKATDPIKAFGTVIGKALKPLKEGKGMIPVLVALQ